MAHLTYYVKDAFLVGDIDAAHFQFKALSGGWAGSKPDRSVHAVANNPYLGNQVEDDKNKIPGGPIPCGTYSLHPNLKRHSKKDHKTIIPWIDLIPDPTTVLGNRTGGFAIHGHGTEGSNGCIVPVNPRDLHDLLHATLKVLGNKRGPVTLAVVSGDLPDSSSTRIA